MKTKDKICCCALPAPLLAALAEAFGPAANISSAPAGADLALYAAGSAPPEGLSPAVPCLVLDLQTPQRLGGILRRARQMIESPAFYLGDIALGDAIFQPQEKTISAAGDTGSGSAGLTDKEVDILLCLARQDGQTLKRDALLHYVWRYQPGVDTHTLETHVYRLRQKLSALGGLENLLLTDEDGGYRLSVSPAAAVSADGV
ncbi:MAG: helix-turn-helix domain-containing protein [Alphaproteobacteria bacterium]|nr:helix-turn-helix domain-containing protein [Alphaproteobacteria bacterium]